MLSKCSNPDCSAHFLYLYSGKLFRFDSKEIPARREYGAQPSRGVEFFWLCDECAGRFTLVSDTAHRVRVVPLHARAAAVSAKL